MPLMHSKQTSLYRISIMKKFVLPMMSLQILITACAVNHLDEGLSAGKAGDYAEMQEQCLAATKLPNPDPEAFRCLGEAQLNLGQRQPAEASLLTYLTQVPDDKVVRFTVIHLYFNNGNYSAAQAHLDQVLNQQPENLDALYLLGELHRLSGRCDAALMAYDKALAININFQAAQVAKAKTQNEVCGFAETGNSVDAEPEPEPEPEKPELPAPVKKKPNPQHKNLKAGGTLLDESAW